MTSVSGRAPTATAPDSGESTSAFPPPAAHRAPAGRPVRLAAFVAATALLLYAGQKAYMAVRGEIGMPGSPAPDWVQAQHQHPALEQAGNAALGVMTAMLALATITRWGSRIPRWLLLGSLAVASVFLSMGAAVDIWRMGRDPDNPTATAVLEAAWTVVQIAAWFVVVFSYALRTRPTRDVLR